MPTPLSLRVAVSLLTSAVASTGLVIASAAAGHAAVPSSHVEQCADAGLKHAGSMTLVSSDSGQDRSGKHTTRARAWAYGVAGDDEVCVVTKVVAAKVRNRRGQSTDYSVGHQAESAGHVLLDTGEVLPVESSMSGFGGSSERTNLAADVVQVVETERVSADDASYLPPSLAGLVGHEGTLTMTSLSIDLTSQAWTSRHLARPLTTAQRTKKRAAEIKVAKARYAERVEEATAARDEQLALTATETGLAAAWRTFMAETTFDMDRMFARMSLLDGKQLARQHAADAARGTDTRESYLHQIELTVPLG